MSAKIDQAFLSAFIAEDFGYPIAHEGVGYDPEDGVAFVELRQFPNEILPMGLASLNDTTGLFQFTMRFPPGQPAIVCKQARDAIFAAFPVGRVLTYEGQGLKITGHHPYRAEPDGGRFVVVGRINYRAFIAR